jgi:hypothetical protein
MMMQPPHDTFFADLPVIIQESGAFNSTNYRPAPDDWYLVVTDVRGSTQAIAGGQHKTVNFVAATSIAALKNMCAPTVVPFLFGGDGAVIMLPSGRGDEARRVLARLRGMIRREFGLELAVGCVTVADVRRAGHDILVGRYEPTEGNNFGVFLGGGVSLLEKSIKGKGSALLQAASLVPEELDDGGEIDLTGLSCRWADLKSTHGKMLSLIVIAAPDVLRDVYDSVQQIAAGNPTSRPVRMDTLRSAWPPAGYLLEARARHKSGPLPFTIGKILLEALIAHISIKSSRSIGLFDPMRYKAEIVTNTDFCRYDDMLFFVMDCRTTAIPEVANYLEKLAHNGDLRFGLHMSDTALMTCLVTSWSANRHVHFVDGANGGYTKAAEVLKGNVTLQQALAPVAL